MQEKQTSSTPPNLVEEFLRQLDEAQARYGPEEAMERAIEAMTILTTRDGCEEDEIPGAYGEFGLCSTNPVPVFSVFRPGMTT